MSERPTPAPGRARRGGPARAAAATPPQGGELAAVIAAASDAIVSTDEAGRIELFNPGAERVFGRSAAQMIGQPLDVLLPPAALGAHAGHLQRFADSKVTRRAMAAGQVEGLHADGRRLALEASISQARVGGRTVLTAILRDVTERVQAEQALARTQRELAALSQRLLAQEKETTHRLALALHDELGQTVAALRLIVDALQAALPADALPARRLWEHADALVGTANRQLRQVLTDLRPPLLDEQGLAAALDNELRQAAATAGALRLELRVADGLRARRWPGEVEYAAFMVAREAVVNAVRHARASRVDVTLAGDARRLELAVRDDGIGLPAEAHDGRPGHLGLVGMRERALAIAAPLQIDAAPGRGTVVRLHWAAVAP